MAQAALRRAATGGCAAVRVPRDDSKTICVVRFRVAIDRLPVRLSQRVVEQRRPSASEKPPSRAREAPPPAQPCCAGRLRRRRHRERLTSGAHDPCASSRVPSPLLARLAAPPSAAAMARSAVDGIRRRRALQCARRVLAVRASSRRRPFSCRPCVTSARVHQSYTCNLRGVRGGARRLFGDVKSKPASESTPRRRHAQLYARLRMHAVVREREIRLRLSWYVAWRWFAKQNGCEDARRARHGPRVRAQVDEWEPRSLLVVRTRRAAAGCNSIDNRACGMKMEPIGASARRHYLVPLGERRRSPQ